MLDVESATLLAALLNQLHQAEAALVLQIQRIVAAGPPQWPPGGVAGWPGLPELTVVLFDLGQVRARWELLVQPPLVADAGGPLPPIIAEGAPLPPDLAAVNLQRLEADASPFVGAADFGDAAPLWDDVWQWVPDPAVEHGWPSPSTSSGHEVIVISSESEEPSDESEESAYGSL